MASTPGIHRDSDGVADRDAHSDRDGPVPGEGSADGGHFIFVSTELQRAVPRVSASTWSRARTAAAARRRSRPAATLTAPPEDVATVDVVVPNVKTFTDALDR